MIKDKKINDQGLINDNKLPIYNGDTGQPYLMCLLCQAYAPKNDKNILCVYSEYF